MFDPTAQWDEGKVMYVFNTDLLPFLKKEGQKIGERAMQGDELCTDIIRRYNVFEAWKDPMNLKLLTNLLKKYSERMPA